MKLNTKNLNYKRVARQKSRQKKGDAPRKTHVALRLKAVSGKRTKKHQRRVQHREKMREQELESLGLIPEGADELEDDDHDGAKELLPHQAKAAAEALAAAKGGRVKGRARKALKVAGLDPRRPGLAPGQKPKGRAAAAIAAALAERDGGGKGGAAAAAAGAAAGAGGGGGDVMEE